ncbi:MAG TPA: sigma-70 family RNA polymerase sigma factor [Fibrobacteria bacterium]|nr:sigma-70 family RNA polymerase sigma factor [Fibrobacteria bacterium]
MLPPLLRMAIKAGSLETVRSALKQGLDPNLQDSDGNSILLHSLRAKQLPICQLLLQHGADPSLKSIAGTSALDLVDDFDESNVLQLRHAPEFSPQLFDDLSDEEDSWIAEQPTSLPESDHEIVSKAIQRQSLFEDWAAIDHDDTWEDVEIFLPNLFDRERLERPLIKAVVFLTNLADQYGVIDPIKISDLILSIPIDEELFDDTFVKIEHILTSRGIAVESCTSEGYGWDEEILGQAESDQEFLDYAEATLSNKMTALSLFQKALFRTSPMSREEEKDCFEKLAKDPDNPRLRERILLSNLRFAYKTGATFCRENKGVGTEDRISEAIFGLIRALDSFDIRLDNKFISYAVHWIRQRIQKTLQDNEQNIRIPPNKLLVLNRFRKSLLKLGGDINATLTLEEFHEQKDEIIKLFNLSEEFSLDTLLLQLDDADDSSQLLSSLGVDADIERECEAAELAKMLNKMLDGNLTEREARVLRMYYGIGYLQEFSMDEIGGELHLTRERVRQIRNKSLNKLAKNWDARDILSPFLPGTSE